MVSKKQISKNNTQNEEIITEEEKNMLKELYLQQQKQQEIEDDDNDNEKIIKPKRQISDAQREALARAREMALLKKKELKEITEKKKVIQHIKKEEKKLDVEKEYKETLERFNNKQEKPIEDKPKERKIKKIIYEDEDEEDENVKKSNKFSYSELTKKSAMEQMKDKINEDRLKFLYQKYILR
jgi:hypothetical protein